MSKITDIVKIGQVYKDTNHEFNCENDMSFYYVVLSRDYNNSNEMFWWTLAKTWQMDDGFKGMHICQFTDNEMLKLELAGGITITK
jgi:hypothetical protein